MPSRQLIYGDPGFHFHSYASITIRFAAGEGTSDLTIPNGSVFGGQSNGPRLQEYNPFKRDETYTYGTDTDGDDVGDSDTGYLWRTDPTDPTSDTLFGWQEVSTKDIYFNAEDGTLTFNAPGNYFIVANFSLEPFTTGGAVADSFSALEQDTPIIRFRINGEIVFEHRQIHILTQTSGNNGQDIPTLGHFIFAVKAGDVLTATVFLDDMDDGAIGSTDRGRSRPISVYMGSNLTVLKINDVFANLRYDNDANSQSGGGPTGSILFKNDLGGAVTNFSNGMSYDPTTGNLTPTLDTTNNTRKMFMMSTARISGSTSSHTLKLNISGAVEGDLNKIGGRFGTHTSYDPQTNTIAVINEVNATGSIRTFLTASTAAVTPLKSGSSLSVFGISSDKKLPYGGIAHPTSYFGYRILGAGGDTAYSEDITDTLNFSANAFYTASYHSNFQGEFTLPATGLDFPDPTTEHPQTGRVTINEDGHYFVWLGMPINAIGTMADNDSGPGIFMRRATGSSASDDDIGGDGWWNGWVYQKAANNFSTSLNDPADYNLVGIFEFKARDRLTFGMASLNGRFKPGVNIVMWKVDHLREVDFFAQAPDTSDEIGDIGREKDGGTDVGSLDHSKQHDSVTEQVPVILGTKGPTSLRGRAGGSLPFRVTRDGHGRKR